MGDAEIGRLRWGLLRPEIALDWRRAGLDGLDPGTSVHESGLPAGCWRRREHLGGVVVSAARIRPDHARTPVGDVQIGQ